jgi:hypothetical protein
VNDDKGTPMSPASNLAKRQADLGYRMFVSGYRSLFEGYNRATELYQSKTAHDRPQLRLFLNMI